MISKHLSDTDLQEYALDNSHAETHIVMHLQACDVCKERVQLYQKLFSGIEAQPTSDFNFDLSRMVLSKIQSKPIFSWAIFCVYVFTVTGIASIGIAFYLLKEYILNILYEDSSLVLYLILMPAVTILLFQLLEFYKTYKAKINALKIY